MRGDENGDRWAREEEACGGLLHSEWSQFLPALPLVASIYKNDLGPRFVGPGKKPMEAMKSMVSQEVDDGRLAF